MNDKDFDACLEKLRETSMKVVSTLTDPDQCEVYETDNKIMTFVDKIAKSFWSFEMSGERETVNLFPEVIA